MSQSAQPSAELRTNLPQKPATLHTCRPQTETDKPTKEIQLPTPDESPTEASSKLDDNMFKPGQKALVSGHFHVYTVKATDLRTGKPLENHKALLRKHIISKLDPDAETVAIGNMTFLSCSNIQLKIGDTVSDPLKKAVLVELVESTDKSGLEVKCLTKNNKPLTLADFEKCGSGHKARWFRFVALDVGSPSHGSPSEMEIGPLRASCHWTVDGEGRASGRHRCFALTFSCETFDLTKFQTRSELPPQNVLDHFAASQLPRYVKHVPGFDEQQSLIFRGAYVIGGAEKRENGIEYRSTLKASLVFTKVGDRPSLTWKDCKATPFLPETTVAEFLVQHFGDQTPCGLNDHQLAKASQFLKGVRVCVAVISADRPVVATIHSLEGSARWNPESMFGTSAGASSIECLRYPDLPCVNVGSEQRPFFYPPELCQIQRDQSYTGPLPLHIEPITFSTTVPVLKERQAEHISSSGDPFMDVGETDFTLVFVQLVDSESHAGNTTVSTTAWKSFQHELGQRFGGKLASSVLGAKQFSGDLQQLRDHLTHKTYRNTDVKNVVLIAAPASISRSELDTFKTFCDVKIGVQVQLVAAAEVNRRYKRDPENRGMVMYSGQIVRKIFARALIPGRPNAGSKVFGLLNNNKNKKRFASSGIFGINIQLLDDQSYANGSSECRKSYLITVVSAAGDRIKSVPTTTTIFTVGVDEDSDVLKKGISQAFTTHVSASRPARPLETAVVYLSGQPMHLTQDQIVQLAGEFRRQFPALLKRECPPVVEMCFSLITMTPETRISVSAAPVTGSTPEFDEFFPLSSENVPAIDESARTGHLVLGQVYRKPAGYHTASGDYKASTKLWHTLRCKLLPAGNFETEELLNKAREPSILQLAVKANKRSMGRVVKDSGEYKVLDVKQSLKGTLWYL